MTKSKTWDAGTWGREDLGTRRRAGIRGRDKHIAPDFCAELVKYLIFFNPFFNFFFTNSAQKSGAICLSRPRIPARLRVPKSSRPHVPAAPRPRGPASPRPRVPASPRPTSPRPASHVPVQLLVTAKSKGKIKYRQVMPENTRKQG